MVKAFTKVRKTITKDYAIPEIKENLENGGLHFGDRITIIGTFSEYLPFVDLKSLLKEARLFPKTLPRTVRIEPLIDTYCGALFKTDAKNAFAEEVVPIFYNMDSRMLEHYTGEMLELKCKITQIPTTYKNLINPNRYFVFEKEEGVEIPFGLNVLDVQPYGLVDTFETSAGMVGNINPPVVFKMKENEKSCRNCQNLFAYMAINPVDFPIRYGCQMSSSDISASKKLKEQTEAFLKLEEQNKSYIVFPRIFELFEVFYPKVDILNEEETKICNDILCAIRPNMEELLSSIPAAGLKFPKKSEITIDFLYDQRKKIMNQAFDPTNVPKWTCPHYEFNPNWSKKLTKEQLEEIKNREEFRLHFKTKV